MDIWTTRQPLRWRTRARRLVVLAYALTVILVHGVHDHEGHAARPQQNVACDSGGLHLADHPDAPDLSQGHEPCLACVLRHSWGLRPVVTGLGLDRAVVPHVALTDVETVSVSPVSHQSRAPPLA